MEPVGQQLADAWERYDCFHDAAIRKVELNFRPDRNHHFEIELDGGRSGTRMDVRFRFTEVKEYRFWEQNWVMELIFEAAWAKLDGLIWVAFDGDDVDDDAPTVEEFRECYAYVAAKSVELIVAPAPTD